jgi:enamine deaminase RidA (YjgF/YER057c/UK114 family)
MSTIEERLKAANIVIPEAPRAPTVNYIPYTTTGNVVFISGQLPFVDGKIFTTGQLGKGVSLEDGQATARVCAINVLTHIKTACGGDLSRVKKVLKLEVLVAAVSTFHEPHVVANGASQVMKDVFGAEIGSHARVAYGVSVLPLDAAVEVAATFEIS